MCGWDPATIAGGTPGKLPTYALNVSIWLH